MHNAYYVYIVVVTLLCCIWFSCICQDQKSMIYEIQISSLLVLVLPSVLDADRRVDTQFLWGWCSGRELKEKLMLNLISLSREMKQLQWNSKALRIFCPSVHWVHVCYTGRPCFIRPLFTLFWNRSAFVYDVIRPRISHDVMRPAAAFHCILSEEITFISVSGFIIHCCHASAGFHCCLVHSSSEHWWDIRSLLLWTWLYLFKCSLNLSEEVFLIIDQCWSSSHQSCVLEPIFYNILSTCYECLWKKLIHLMWFLGSSRYKVLFFYIKVLGGTVEDILNETYGFIKVRELWISPVYMKTHEMQSFFLMNWC